MVNNFSYKLCLICFFLLVQTLIILRLVQFARLLTVFVVVVFGDIITVLVVFIVDDVLIPHRRVLGPRSVGLGVLLAAAIVLVTPETDRGHPALEPVHVAAPSSLMLMLTAPLPLLADLVARVRLHLARKTG